MPAATVSVITATDLRPDRVPYLLELHTDLHANAATSEWVVCIDGDHHQALPEPIATDPRVVITHAGRRVGTAAARNLALGKATGTWVTSADDDDRLPAGSLDVRLDAARVHAVSWVAGLLADLRDGHLTVWDCPAARGPMAAGGVWRTWGAASNMFPLGPTTVLAHADLMRAVGGWQGLPQGEDFGMVMALTSLADGHMLEEVVYHYRKHPGQLMASPSFAALEADVRAIAFERGRLLSPRNVSTAVASHDRAAQDTASP